VFKELVERLAQQVESGAVEWKGKAESLAALSQTTSEAGREPLAETLATELETSHLAPASGVQPRGEAELEPAEELAQEFEPLPGPVEAPEVSSASLATAAHEAAVLGEVTEQPGHERVEEVLEEVAAAVEGDSDTPVTAGWATETWPNELTLVYEISAEELPPAEVELAEDYSQPPETSQPRALPALERIDDVQLPYEARAKRRRVAAGSAADRASAGGGRKGRSSASKRSSTVVQRRKPPAPDGTPDPGVPVTD
jgi:hypothetical protein